MSSVILMVEIIFDDLNEAESELVGFQFSFNSAICIN